ncbi:MAG: hydroxyethylthiazole kinase [Candidatus Cloacimonadales bacterium]
MKLNVWNDVEKIRKTSPLIHNITNYVVMNNTANGLLSLGASPIMSHAIDEAVDMTSIVNALVVNIGTLSENWIKAMKISIRTAGLRKIPIVIDPVGAGATQFRTKTAKDLFAITNPTVIRGNASEIMALVDTNIQTKGVDSSHSSNNALQAALSLAKQYKCIVVVSGEIDIITDGTKTIYIENGDKMMPRVTGLGCTATALVAAFCAVNTNYLEACANAMAVMGICGEIAVKTSVGPASLQLNFLDKLYTLTQTEVDSTLRYHE